MTEYYDVVVIGSGIGGSTAAARLAHKGYKTLLAERLPFLGGRLSSIDHHGYQIPTGGIGMAPGGYLQQTFEEVGAEFDVRNMPTTMIFRINGADFSWPITDGMPNALMTYAEDKAGAQKVLEAIPHALMGNMPSDDLSVHDWLSQFTQDRRVHHVIGIFCVALFGTNIYEFSASQLLLCIAGANKIIGGGLFTGAKGNVTLHDSLARSVVANGGAVWREAEATQILVENQAVKGVVFETSEGRREVAAKVVVSNAGPKRTVQMTGHQHFDGDYRARVEMTGPPSSVFMEVLFSSDEPLMKEPGVLWPLDAKYVLCIIPTTLTAPELAPPGKHITNVYAGILEPPFDIDAKSALDACINDFYELFPEARTKSQILHKGCWHKEWPVFRDVDVCLTQKTPVANLYNVGDGVRISGLSGTTLCAETARVVVEDIVASVAPQA